MTLKTSPSPVSSSLIIITDTHSVSLQQWPPLKTSKFAPAVISPLPPLCLLFSSYFLHLLLFGVVPPSLPHLWHLERERAENFHHQQCNCCHRSHSVYFSPSSRGPCIKHSLHYSSRSIISPTSKSRSRPYITTFGCTSKLMMTGGI